MPHPLSAAHCCIILLGATGDLAKRKLFPALYRMIASGKLPDVAIIGAGLENSTADQVLQRAEEFAQPTDMAAWQKLRESFSYLPLDFDDKTTFASLKIAIESLEQKKGLSGNRLFFLATMPEHFITITNALAEHNIVHREIPGAVCAGKPCPWQRVIYEKPFGSDLASAQKINQAIARVFSEEQAYRIDHYLGKELVGNIGLIRFANTIFGQLWNSNHIASVQIVLSETLDIGTRGAFYDQYGALKDVVQNHMLQLIALIGMEEPAEFSGQAIRSAKVRVLQDTVIQDVLLGQYAGYQQTTGVAPDSTQETFAALKVAINNQRWYGVPFFLKTGKALAKKATAVHIVFKTPQSAEKFSGTIKPNILSLQIEPEEGFYLQLTGKQPEKNYRATSVDMKFCHKTMFGPNTPQAYEVLLLDAINGDQSVFVRFDEIEHSWNIIDKITQQKPSILSYERGSQGPEQLAEWSREHGVTWLD